jgi:hypothetical protein
VRERLGPVADEVVRHARMPVLVARAPEAQEHELADKQCPQCVVVRADSDGDHWFCDRHAHTYLGTSTLLLPSSVSGLGHGPMW